MCLRDRDHLRRVINLLRPEQKGRNFADDILKCVFLMKNVSFSPKLSLMVHIEPALVHVMA